MHAKALGVGESLLDSADEERVRAYKINVVGHARCTYWGWTRVALSRWALTPRQKRWSPGERWESTKQGDEKQGDS